ncbi:MAG: hypothetical protein BWX70_00845 [Verrucomicrobia bacterium ADurb.Bin070]|nr:MAG: hypothetical protein BWX70_00845 [Verrucomicrobia bacterium ADurb.Bin070]
MVVPIFMPKTKATAVSNEITPLYARLIEIAAEAAEDWMTAVTNEPISTHFSTPHRVEASNMWNHSMNPGSERSGERPLLMSSSPKKTRPMPKLANAVYRTFSLFENR